MKHDKSYMAIAKIIAANSYAKKLKVGALVVKNETIIADGYNGTVSGFTNKCEDDNGKTYPHVLHAEANALSKIMRSNNSSLNATIFVTHAPCLNCAKMIIQAGISRVVYDTEYKSKEGVDLMKLSGIDVLCLK